MKGNLDLGLHKFRHTLGVVELLTRWSRKILNGHERKMIITKKVDIQKGIKKKIHKIYFK